MLRETSDVLTEPRQIRRMAMLVVHSDPLAEPGAGDAGGMTVYTRQIARSLAARGIEVDLYTRRHDADAPAQTELLPGVRVLQVDAGSPGLAKEQIPAYLPQFTSNLVRMVEAEFGTWQPYDIIHSHYWLSGKVAGVLKARWSTPFVHTFHTLGLVKNHSLRPDDFAEPEARLHGEAKVIEDACAIVASSEEERRSLIELYAAHPERIYIVPPGVDHSLFYPGVKEDAKKKLGLEGKKVVLFVGRLQPLKAADTAIRAVAHLVEANGGVRGGLPAPEEKTSGAEPANPPEEGGVRGGLPAPEEKTSGAEPANPPEEGGVRGGLPAPEEKTSGAEPANPPEEKGGVRMLVVGGSSGLSGAGELERLRALAEANGLSEIVQFVPVQPQNKLRDFYQAADVCLVPSRSESFGLVALEAQACGTPVVGSSVGGLRSIVKEGVTGFLVDSQDIEGFATKAGVLLNDPKLAAGMGKQAELASQDFCWDKSAAELHELYAASGAKPECLSRDLAAAT